MGKKVDNSVLDGALNIIKNNCTSMVALAAEPADFAAAVAGKLVEAAMAPADFTIADGVTNGRRVTVSGKADQTVIGAGGTVTHVALLDTPNSRLLYVTTSPSQAVPGGGTASFAGWDIEIADPA